MSLVIPFLVDGAGSSGSTYDFEPIHITSWTTQAAAGPSRYTALASPDNSIWVYPQPSAEPETRRQGKLRSDRPEVIATEPTPSDTPAGRPGNPRLSSFSQRSRAPSVASSTRTSSSRHRVTSFSPPSTAQAVLTSLSPTTATATANDGHGRAHSLTERAELIEHLREQQARNSHEGQGRSSVGLGINLGRKLDVQGQADHGRESGTTSPRSVKSVDSGSTSIGGRLMEWAKGSEDESSKARRELSDQVAEIAVEREMQKEEEEDAKQEEERKVIDAAMAKSSPGQPPSGHTAASKRGITVRRIILREPGRGRIVCLKVFEDQSLLCILRDNGMLDIFRTDTLGEHAALDLEEPERRRVASSSKTPLRLSPFWKWQDLHFLSQGHESILIAEGLPWSCGMPSHNGDVTRVIIMSTDPTVGLKIESRLELPGQGSVGICCPSEEPILLHSTSSSLTSYTIHLKSGSKFIPPDRPSTPGFKPQNRAVSSADPSPRLGPTHKVGESEQPLLRKHQSFASLRDAQQTPNEEKGFAKFLAAKKADWRGERKVEEVPISQAGIEIGPGKEVERNGGGRWRRFTIHGNGEGLGLVDDAVEIFTFDGSTLQVKGTITLEPDFTAQDVFFSRSFEHISVIARDKLTIYEGKETTTKEHVTTKLRESVSTTGAAVHMASRDALLACTQGIGRIQFDEGSGDVDIIIKKGERAPDKGQVIVPSSLGTVWTADVSGTVSRRSLTDLMKDKTSTPSDDISGDRLDSSVTCMKVVGLEKRYLVAGDEDGVVRIWDENGTLQGSWTLFADPVENVAVVDLPDTALHDHLLCTSREGTIGVISLKEMDHLYLIPASRAPLRRIFVGGKDILLAYANGKARVWNVETMEFRRSTGIDAADEMLQIGTWSEIVSKSTTTGGLTSNFSQIGSSSDAGGIISLDPAKAFSEIKSLPTLQGLDVVRGMLSVFLPFGLNDAIDEVCTDKLKVPVPKRPVTIGKPQLHGSLELVYAARDTVWHSTPEETGLRQLMIIALLRYFLEHEAYERYAAEVIAYYTASLPDDIVHAGIEYFASFYIHTSQEIQHAARMLFDSALDRMEEQELQELIEQHQPHLTPGPSSDEEAGQALLIIGGIGLHKFQSVNPTALKAVSEAILRVLHDPSSPHLALAIELCSRGFTIWQSYVDPMELLRRLFHLSTRKDSSSSSAHARLAVLHVASSNPALFMSTLSMDILDAKSAEGRTSIMKLCVYMARKKPEVLENGLPRIAEAVVKSLDPNIAKMRDDVWQAATVILNELVLAFSTIDFHSGTQKLAVGTHEGAVIMYELKTASRLYVLEPHRAPVSSVTFSPDGRRLLTVSLEEGAVTVWKVGSSLSGFFNVGGPPRQGALGGSGPFKRIEFARIEDAPLRSTSALSEVHVSWPGARQAKVEIGETAMSFET